ncbi:isoleucine--tRNA ligase [Candidatus Pacearchaeota archaeon]|nr:isoleucine--tRNA ligase [Candidatus Pacearchaeota archaeon]
MVTGLSESEILEFWKKNKIYDKLKKARSKGKKFYLMDGPPYATGHIHMGTALNKILKDVAIRSQRMQGKDVFDRPGYDTHGLPIEFQVEKEIGSKTKKDIEIYGVDKFIAKCREYATKHIDAMNEEFYDLGVWMDWKNPYLTLKDDYIEGLWFILKKAYEQNMLYLGKYPVHCCPRCATAVSFNEIEYNLQKDNAIYIKFPLKNKKNTSLIIWTTTPWTLPANTGVMIHPDLDYAEIEVNGTERWILLEELVEKRMKEFNIEYKFIKKFKGKTLEGLNYENPVSKNTRINLKNSNRIVSAPRYVTTTDGTGLVHCAPGHGKEDYDIGKQNNLDQICFVGIDGIMNLEAGKYAGKKAREVDKEIIEDLKKDGFLIYEHSYSHDYPSCWRCKNPLIMISLPQWFLRITKMQSKLLKMNDEINWAPKWAQARMKAWLGGISDWPISRERFWGTPLPIWECEKCNNIKVVGSLAELKKLSGMKQIDMHKPGIDKVNFICSCKSKMNRVTGVLDVWFDSGATSWSALGYPSKKQNFEKYWPADLNIEGTDQFRGWWNAQLILSIIGFDKKPVNSITLHGMVLDLNKKKMSKSKGNVVAPKDVILKYNRDYLRYSLIKLSRGEDFSYNEKEFLEIQKFLNILSNIDTFINQLNSEVKEKLNVEDKWILSRFNNLIKEINKDYNEYKFYGVIDSVEQFVIQDLSRTYIKLIRERADETKKTLSLIYKGLLQILSPITPFMTEKMWQLMLKENSKLEESIHLSKLPEINNKLINLELEKNFTYFKSILERGLSERDRAKIGLKWPLASVKIQSPEKLKDELSDLLKQQLNIKEIIFQKGKELSVVLDTTMTPELEAEGFAREVSRRIQSERKNKNMKKEERIVLELFVSDKLKEFLLNYKDFISKRVGATKIIFNDGKKDVLIFFDVKNEKIGFHF